LEEEEEGGRGGGMVFHSKSTGIFPKIAFSLLQYYQIVIKMLNKHENWRKESKK
jgi:hypothetical protein